ncbi:hypothetical protein ABT294_35435 [Nonomuraea sp. NPDC000554]|uniref:hypothetical protein n=1 Tax=Nonomuraea sp. NPDC000554 TaxID=3154259 RepID=UPI00331FDCAB
MTNGARHALGVVAGLLFPPLIAAGLAFGIGDTAAKYQQFVVSWLGLVVVALSALLLAFLLGSRMSPVASLMGGLAFTALGLVPWIEMQGVRVLPLDWIDGPLRIGFQTLLYSGVFFLLGVTMLVVSAFPSRWRGARAALAAPEHAHEYGMPAPYPPAPYPPSPSHTSPSHTAPYSTLPEDATRPMHRE